MSMSDKLSNEFETIFYVHTTYVFLRMSTKIACNFVAFN